jgi:hypothetical protein
VTLEALRPFARFAEPLLELPDLQPQEHRRSAHTRTGTLPRRDAETKGAAVEGDVPRIDLDEDIGERAMLADGLVHAFEQRSDNRESRAPSYGQPAELACPPPLRAYCVEFVSVAFIGPQSCRAINPQGQRPGHRAALRGDEDEIRFGSYIEAWDEISARFVSGLQE